MRISERQMGGAPSPNRPDALQAEDEGGPVAGVEAGAVAEGRPDDELEPADEPLAADRPGLLAWLRTPDSEPEPYVADESRIGHALFWPALIGAIGSGLVLWGASQPTSPFTLNHATISTLGNPELSWAYARLWYFGAGSPRGNVLVGVVAVYAGMFLVIRAWLALARLTRLYPGIPVRRFVPVFVVWLLPLLVVAPLFSHDAFSYVGQGEEMTRGANPYIYPPTVLGNGGANPYVGLIDHWWVGVTSPYGPVFLGLAGWIVALVNHNELLAVLGFRALEVVGVVLLAVFIPRLARSYGRDGAQAFVLVVLNPLVLFHLVGGEHNDAIMMGLLAAGLTLARERHPIAGVILCTVAGLVKAPAFIGVVYVGWDWAGAGVALRARLRPLAKTVAVAGVTTVAITYLIGIGWGWVAALRDPGAVSSWMDPGTGIGGLIARVVNAVGLGEHSVGIIDVAHAIGLAAAGVIAVWLLLRSDGGVSSLRAMGLTLLAVVVLGPVIQPWYLAWGIIVLAPIAAGRGRAGLVLLSAVMSFLGLPGGRLLLRHIENSGLLTVVAAVAALLAVALLSFAPRLLHVAKVRRSLGHRVIHASAGGTP
jgi:alpha-1,6-mannosyltransferase